MLKAIDYFFYHIYAGARIKGRGYLRLYDAIRYFQGFIILYILAPVLLVLKYRNVDIPIYGWVILLIVIVGGLYFPHARYTDKRIALLNRKYKRSVTTRKGQIALISLFLGFIAMLVWVAVVSS